MIVARQGASKDASTDMPALRPSRIGAMLIENQDERIFE
jgi:hypothetical protein